MSENNSKSINNANLLTIINYHFVREKPNINNIKLNALSKKSFIKQLDFMNNKYNFISATDCIDAIYNKKKLPNNPIMLTFDDGYIDHYKTVFPLLVERSIRGCFFPVAKVLKEREILEVNKIQMIIGSAKINLLINDLLQLIKKNKLIYNLNNFEFYKNNISYKHPFDSKDVVFIKNLLQIALKPDIRKIFIDYLFNKYVTNDESELFEQLYLSVENIKVMMDYGMYFGSHGFSHQWLNKLNYEKQKNEILKSIKFLDDIEVNKNELMISYPFGGYNENTIKILQQNNYKLGFSTNAGKAYLSKNNAFSLQRFDTNHLFNI